MKKTRMFAIMALIVAMLLAALPAYAADPTPGEGNTDVVVTNTNQNTGASPASVTAIYYNQGGAVEYQRPRTINSRGSYNFKAADAQLGDDWKGSMVVQSDAELAAIAEIHYTGGSFSDGKEADSYTGYAQGASDMYFPFVVYNPNRQYTALTVQNTEDTAITVRMTFINRDGVTDFANIDSQIPAFGSKTYSTKEPGVNGMPNLTQTSYFAQKGNWTGAVKITALNSKKIAAVASNQWLNYSVAYNGLVSGAAQNYIPSAERRFDSALGWRGFSQILVQCLATTSCNVALDFINGSSGQTNLTLTKTVASNAAIGANTNTGGDFDPNQYASALGNNWQGSVIVRSTNSTNLGVIAYSIRPGTNVAGGTSAAATTDAGLETFLPAVYQKNTQNVSCPSSDSAWTIFSLIRIQNPGTVNATNVDIYYYNSDGSTVFQELDRQVQAGKSYNRNTRVMCNEIPLGGNWTGSVYIRGDQPLVAVIENLWGNAEMAAYNGYSITR
jgi:hypothetical protein